MTETDWSRITSGDGRAKHTVYWIKWLADGRRLTVARIYSNDGTYTTGRGWRWRVWAVKQGMPVEVAEAGGTVTTVTAGKAAAMKAVAA